MTGLPLASREIWRFSKIHFLVSFRSAFSSLPFLIVLNTDLKLLSSLDKAAKRTSFGVKVFGFFGSSFFSSLAGTMGLVATTRVAGFSLGYNASY